MKATKTRALKKCLEMEIVHQLMVNRTEHARQCEGWADNQVRNRNIITNYTLSFLHRFITSQAAVRRKAYWNVLCCKLTQEPFIKRKIVCKKKRSVWRVQRLRLITAMWHNHSERFQAKSSRYIRDVQHVVALSYWISGSERKVNFTREKWNHRYVQPP